MNKPIRFRQNIGNAFEKISLALRYPRDDFAPKRDEQRHLAGVLDEFAGHLKELRDHPEAHAEFFNLYVGLLGEGGDDV